MKKRYLIKRKKGQLIVFGVLVFPVIFFCLAMVINIGMVVHDKINLQNAVDLAAIYAAQKQAEVMDAMAHINYQMRQNYKLFAWRYLVLGNIGAFVEPTISSPIENRGGSRQVINILNDSPQADSRCPNAGSGCVRQACDTPQWREACPYAVCTIHPLFSTTWQTDDTHICQNYRDAGSSARRLPPVTRTAGLLSTISVLSGNKAVRNLRAKLVGNCSDVGFQNWMVAASMYFAFIEDQKRRKEFIQKELFPLLTGGQDIEGKNIIDGVEKTIQKNLTYVNYRNFIPEDSLVFSVVQSNSGSPSPLAQSGTFNSFFKWDEIAPAPSYVQNLAPPPGGTTPDTVNDFCKTTVQSIFQCKPHGSSYNDVLKANPEVLDGAMGRIAGYKPDRISDTWCDVLHQYWQNGGPDRVIGFYKPNGANAKNLGVKVKVTMPYKGQLFFPFFPNSTGMIFSAEAYAKPFGASFGSSESDRLIPKGANGGDPNYALIPNDGFGLTNEKVQWAWNFLFMNGNSIGGQNARDTSKRQGRTFNNYSGLPQNTASYRDPMFLHYKDAPSSSSGSVSVTLDDLEIFTKQMRIYEEMAIAPDPFDVENYTILPNYMLTLYPKLKKAFPGKYVPADLGHFQNGNPTMIPQAPVYIDSHGPPNGRRVYNPQDPIFRLNYIERQIIYANHLPSTQPFAGHGIDQVLPYRGGDFDKGVKSVNDLLTSWTPLVLVPGSSPNQFVRPSGCELSDERVKLEFQGQKDPFLSEGLERKLTPSHCLKGGRTGFSVKLVHPDVL